jgi:predicted Zn-dependent peptidase
MYFRGTARYPTSYDLNFAIETLGGTLYAETARDYSLYQITLDPGLVDQGLELFGEIFGRPRFGDIELERQLILEELNEDYDERGLEVSGEEIIRALIFGDHPLAYRITGPRENVERFSDADLWRHRDRLYGASNAILCVAGPVRADAVAASAARHLGALPRGAEAVSVAPAFEARGALYRYVSDPGSQTTVHVVFRAVPEIDPSYTAVQAMLRVIDDGMSTRLHYRLCDQLGLAYSIGAGLEPLHDVALLDVEGATAHPKVPELLRQMFALVGELREQLVSPAELDKVKRRYRYDFAASFDDANAMASWFGGTALYYPPPSFEERIARMEAVTAEDIRAAAQQVLRPERLAVVVVGGLGRGRQAEVRGIVEDWR